ncbi:hypothetical protein PBRA_006467 [Plasmodiophora brassicae]|uniref:Peptidase S54 rhomboid domain-containing protein n=1 Tax=Plasmodiophora brassicae TaxID=37360 RepID=A0A0G4ISL5_PLABS|nr:hypothetical protein PBRA_006467 [Plasmodiophora brassicae]
MDQQQGSRGGRLAEALADVPDGCRLVLGVCAAVFAVTTLTGDVPVICPGSVVFDPWTYAYMLVVPSFVHLGALHILFNMMALLSVGVAIEKRFGTLCFVGIVMVFAVLGNAVYVLAYWAWAVVGGDATMLMSCAAGFSGVLFGMIVLESMLGNTSGSRSVFGLVAVPSWAYPWVSMVAIQLLMPGVSFVGHLSGAFIGLLYSCGVLNWLTLKRSWIRSFDASSVGQKICRRPSYVACPETSPLPPGAPYARLRRAHSFATASKSHIAISEWFASAGLAVVSRLRAAGNHCRSLFRIRRAAPHWTTGVGHRLGGVHPAYELVGRADIEAGTAAKPPVHPPT